MVKEQEIEEKIRITIALDKKLFEKLQLKRGKIISKTKKNYSLSDLISNILEKGVD